MKMKRIRAEALGAGHIDNAMRMSNKIIGYIAGFVIVFGGVMLYYKVAMHLFYTGWGFFGMLWPIVILIGLALMGGALELGKWINKEWAATDE